MEEILKKIELSQKIAIFCHENADGDAIGCVLGLGTLLQNMGKNVKFVVPGGASKVFSFMSGYEKLQGDFEFDEEDLLIMVDCSEYSRLGKLLQGKEDYFNSHNVVVFDHHELKAHPEHWLIIDDSTSTSCCEVILENTKDVREKYYTPEIATSLYLGLTTDSGNFRYDENPERIHENAITLLKFGANKKLIINNLINCKSLETVLFLRKILDRLTIDEDIVYSYYDTSEFEELGIDNEQAGFGLTIIQEIKGPKVSMTIRKTGDTVKCSLRSKETDVHKVAVSFGGGGHIHASGFSAPMEGDFQTTIKNIIQKIKTLI